jgi:hypothetical protein
MENPFVFFGLSLPHFFGFDLHVDVDVAEEQTKFLQYAYIGFIRLVADTSDCEPKSYKSFDTSAANYCSVAKNAASPDALKSLYKFEYCCER